MAVEGSIYPSSSFDLPCATHSSERRCREVGWKDRPRLGTLSVSTDRVFAYNLHRSVLTAKDSLQVLDCGSPSQFQAHTQTLWYVPKFLREPTFLTLAISCGIFNQSCHSGQGRGSHDIPMTCTSPHTLISVITDLASMVSFSISRATSTHSVTPLAVYSQSQCLSVPITYSQVSVTVATFSNPPLISCSLRLNSHGRLVYEDPSCCHSRITPLQPF